MQDTERLSPILANDACGQAALPEAQLAHLNFGARLQPQQSAVQNDRLLVLDHADGVTVDEQPQARVHAEGQGDVHPGGLGDRQRGRLVAPVETESHLAIRVGGNNRTKNLECKVART